MTLIFNADIFAESQNLKEFPSHFYYDGRVTITGHYFV